MGRSEWGNVDSLPPPHDGPRRPRQDTCGVGASVGSRHEDAPLHDRHRPVRLLGQAQHLAHEPSACAGQTIRTAECSSAVAAVHLARDRSHRAICRIRILRPAYEERAAVSRLATGAVIAVALVCVTGARRRGLAPLASK